MAAKKPRASFRIDLYDKDSKVTCVHTNGNSADTVSILLALLSTDAYRLALQNLGEQMEEGTLDEEEYSMILETLAMAQNIVHQNNNGPTMLPNQVFGGNGMNDMDDEDMI